MPRACFAGSAIHTNGIAKAMKRFVQLRGSREPGAGMPRVHSTST